VTSIDGWFAWPEVAARLGPWRSYWLATTNPDGSPHAAPVWGVVVDQAWYAYTERASVKARNLAADPRAVVHLEDGEDVLIVRGLLVPVEAGLEAVVAAFAAKYAEPDDLQYHPSAADPATVFYRLEATAAHAWVLADWDASHRRWDRDAVAGR
jgi:hypothetical protein